MANKTIKKTTVRDAGTFRTEWTNGPKGMGEVFVDVYFNEEEEPMLEWSYPRMRGLEFSANAWNGQVLLQAESELAKRTSA